MTTSNPYPMHTFTDSQLQAAAKRAPDWSLQPLERVQRPAATRRAPRPVTPSRWADRAVWCALVIGAAVALIVR